MTRLNNRLIDSFSLENPRLTILKKDQKHHHNRLKRMTASKAESALPEWAKENRLAKEEAEDEAAPDDTLRTRGDKTDEP